MHFTAQIKRGSAVDRMWRAHRRLGGEVSGVLFSTPNFVTEAYISKGSLHAHAIASIKDNPNIELIATGIPLPLEPPQGAKYLGPEKLTALLPDKLQPAAIGLEEPVEEVDSDEEIIESSDPSSGDEDDPHGVMTAHEVGETVKTPSDAQENVVDDVPDAIKEPTAQENVVDDKTTQQNIVDQSEIETFKPKNTGRRRR